MNIFSFVTWFSEHSNQVLMAFGAPVVIAWFGYFENAENQYPMWFIVGAVVITYYWSKKYLKNYCYNSVSHHAEEFATNPIITENTTEAIVDHTDIDILGIIDGMEEDKGEYVKIIGSIDVVDPEDLLRRLGKLKSLGYIYATRRRVSLTNHGLGMIDSSGIQQISVPPKFSTQLVKAKMYFEEQNYNGVADMVNILFEEIPRSAIQENLGSNLEEEWKNFRSEGRVKRDFDKVSLGELTGVCNFLKIIKKGSIENNILLSFLKLRTPQKHSLNKEEYPLQTAKSALDLADILIRERFQR